MRVAVTGGTGIVGRFFVADALAEGHSVTILSRHPPGSGAAAHQPFDLAGPIPDLTGLDRVVHCAFAHVPGRYRGGEGDDPAGFTQRNVEGTARLLAAAQAAGVRELVFLSSRAVYDGYPAGTALHEGLPARPATLYGEAKARGEAALAAAIGPGMRGAVLRVTGVYGPLHPGHKWEALFAAFRRGEPLAPAVATEVHGGDVASAARLALAATGSGRAEIWNVSDLVLDRRDLLSLAAEAGGWRGALPARADTSGLREMATDRLRATGWRGGGVAALREVLRCGLAPGL